ncbi:hypothetical protein [Ileibacterium valens]|uniref:Uncharacterized protein n=1 Tax=Ileibacterium valens TaxID=1862668 RepID=A0A1U7NHJ3_9FIRM|nr:hypothetical protein [Ileibacterium valens]OLU39732.1 hypothetical protein BO224_06800 [Erysipelotrichaceae bacterium NYU-BL-E8]OLU39972.1 hypothetical protein BM735_06410 [Erysipelotrichaceae bacterium NYU-BL-F16]OLU41299.1 hypothetical protein BO222_03500 [Ileibacterium valens]
MDWAKLKLTADDFEIGSVNESNDNLTYESQKIRKDSRLRVKDLIPVSKAVHIPIKSGYEYFFTTFDENKRYLGNNLQVVRPWGSIVETIKLDPRVCYIALLVRSTPVEKIYPSNVSEALPGYIWTAGQPEFGKLKDGSVYTKGRNLLTGTSNVFAEGLNVQSENSFRWVDGSKDMIRGQQITVSAQFDVDSIVYDTDELYHRTLVEPGIMFKNGTTKWCTVVHTSSDPSTYHGRIYGTFSIPDEEIEQFRQLHVYVQNVKSGKAKISKPMVTLGDEHYPWSSAPEDVDNPTEAV